MLKSSKNQVFNKETINQNKEVETEKPASAVRSFLERKINGAVKEIFKHKELDESVEKNLSQGLENNPDFAAANRKIDRRRNWFSSRINNLLNRKSKGIEITPYVFDEAAMQAMKELEAELTDSFAKNIYGKLADFNKQLLLDHLVDNQISREKSQIIELPTVSEANNNVIAFSDNGYLLQLSNKEDVRQDRNIDVENEKALYNLISPDGKIIAQDLNYTSALEELKTEASSYQKMLKDEFDNQENLMIEESINNTEAKINELVEKREEDERDIASSKEKENEFFDSFEKMPEAVEETEPYLINKEDVVEIEAANPENAENIETENKIEVASNINIVPAVSKYAEGIGIKPEDLAANYEFLSLSPEQQKFALETLRRSSLAKAKVEAHQSFIQEKASKKWWQLGFSLNQNYHKERHQIEAVKNIESRGLEGYGETELAWLIDVVKNGPEIKMNDRGEVIVDCLREEAFDKENEDLAIKYNEIARKYIEYKPKDNKDNKLRDIRLELDDVRQDMMLRAKSRSDAMVMNETFLKARNNTELLRFLSADKETEKLLDKMAGTSTGGFDKALGMVSGQKDKFGYSALGFGIRTGAKFAMANSAYLASAVSYSVAPAAAAIVGGFRGYNLGKKDLQERAELAKLGVEDTSDTAKAMNLATGKKIGQEGQEINFGLTEKLQVLIDKINELKRANASAEEINKAIDSLFVRIDYTEKKMNREEIDYGSIAERNLNYFNLANTLAEAKTTIGMFSEDYHSLNYYVPEEDKKLTRYNKKINLEKRKGETDESYKERMAKNKEFAKYQKWATDESRLAKLSTLSVSDRLSSFLNYKEEKQKKKELDFLIKKTATGAVIGASFAAAGAFIAEQLGVNNWFTGKTDPTKLEAAGLAKKLVSTESKISTGSSASPVHEAPVVKAVEHHVTSTHHLTNRLETNPASQPLETPKDIKPLEVPKVDAEAKPIEISDQTVNAPIDNNIVDHSGVTTEAIPNSSDNTVDIPSTADGSQEVVDAKNAATVVKNLIDKDNVAAKLVNGVYSNNPEFRDEESFLRQLSDLNGGQKLSASEELEAKSIFESFKQNQDYNILNRRMHSFESSLSDKASISPDASPASTEPSVEKIPVSSETVSVPNPDEAANLPIADKDISSVAEVPASNPVEMENTAVINDISKELHIKPESLNQSGDDLVYKGQGKSSVVLDWKTRNIKEVLDTDGKKIPNEFVHEVVGKTKLDRFTRDEGLDKIFSTWGKLNTNDKLVYNSLDWFNKGTLNQEDLLTQIKGLYQVKMENIYIDADKKHFISGEGRSFDMTLKGVKKLVEFLKRR